VPGRAGVPRAEGWSADVGCVPLERPVLPLIRPLGLLQLRRVPLALAGETDLDAGHGPASRPGLAADRTGPGRDHRARRGIRDSRAHTHERHWLVGPVGPLVDVVAGLELP